MEEENFGDLLRAYRDKSGFSQRSLAKYIYVSNSLISRYENNELLPRRDTLLKIIQALADKGLSPEKREALEKAAGYVTYSGDRFNGDNQVLKDIQQGLESADPLIKEAYLSIIKDLVRSVRKLSYIYKTKESRDWAAYDQALAEYDLLDEKIHNKFSILRQEAHGDAQRRSGFFGEAARRYDTAARYAQLNNDPITTVKLSMKQADVTRKLGGKSWEESRRIYEKALKIYQQEDDELGVATCHRKISATFGFEGKVDKALDHSKKSSLIARKFPEHPCFYKGLLHEAWFLSMLGAWTEARVCAEKALRLIGDGSPLERAKGLAYLGDAYRIERQLKETPHGFVINRRYDEAEQTYKEALTLLKDSESINAETDLLLGRLRRRLGMIYIKRPSKIIEGRMFLKTALASNIRLNDWFGSAEVQRELGDLFLADRRYGDAEIFLQQSAERWDVLGNFYQHAITLVSLCHLYHRQQKFDRVMKISEQVDSIDSDLINYQRARIKLVAGKSLINRQEFNKGFRKLCIATSEALQFNNEAFIEIHLDFLSEAERITRELNSKYAVDLYQAYIQYWQQRNVSEEQEYYVLKTIEITEKKASELAHLRAV